MISSFIRVNSRQYLGLLLAVSFCFVPACANSPSKKSGDVEKLQQTLAKREDNIAKLQLRLLERDAQIKQLEERLNSQQEMLDEAIQEVVRAKAKLRSLESKAEAASEMAEAEIRTRNPSLGFRKEGTETNVLSGRRRTDPAGGALSP